LTEAWGRMEWYHVRNRRAPNRYCAMMSKKPLPEGVPMSQLQEAEPEEL